MSNTKKICTFSDNPEKNPYEGRRDGLAFQGDHEPNKKPEQFYLNFESFDLT